MAENPYVNKVIYGNEVLIDLSEDTVTENTLKRGATAHTRSGEQITGELDVLPSGGSDGDVLVKDGETDRAAKWTNTPKLMENLAYINTGSTADKLYNPGEYLVYNGQLYKATGTISPNETLTPGGNIDPISTCGEISDIKTLLAYEHVLSANSKLTPGANINLQAATYTRFGPFVSWQILFTTTNALALNDVIATGFNQPFLPFSGSVTALLYDNGAPNEIRLCKLMTDGSLQTNVAVNAGATLRTTLIYPIA